MSLKTTKIGASYGTPYSAARGLHHGSDAQTVGRVFATPESSLTGSEDFQRGDFRPPYGMPPVEPVVNDLTWGPQRVQAYQQATKAYEDTARNTDAYLKDISLPANDNDKPKPPKSTDPRHSLDAAA